MNYCWYTKGNLFRLLESLQNGLANYEALANYKIKCSKNKFANNHINGIKNFLDMLNIDYINLNG